MTITNSQIADTFDQVADLLEFQSANSFRVRAYRNGARTLRNLTESLEERLASEHALTEIDGIGKDLASKITELVQSGALTMLTELKEQVPDGVLSILRIPGLGPKKAAALHRELHIESLGQLQAACEAQQVRTLKGFGAKTEATILQGIPFAAQATRRMYWSKAHVIAEELREHLAACPAVKQLELAGSYRRGKETVGDLDLLVDSDDPQSVMDHFASSARVNETLLRGDTKMSVRIESGLQIDLRVVPAESFGAALQYFTGSKEHNVALRHRARQQGFKINEYGVHDLKTGKQVAGATEQDVYAAIHLPWFPPELREDRDEFLWADGDGLPPLITQDAICGDLHMHTTATDGKDAIESMIEAAKQRGLKYIAITDHSQRVSMANGLDPERLVAQWQAIDAINQASDSDFVVLKGIECDILEQGGMDLPDEILARADWVLASVHYGQKQSRQQITDRILGALQNPHVTCIAHPTGRLINRREAYAVDMDAIFQAAVEHGKLLELNANPARLDLNDTHCRAARQRGIPIVINTDAHSVAGMDVMSCGIQQARRGGLTAADVANTRSLESFRAMLPGG